MQASFFVVALLVLGTSTLFFSSARSQREKLSQAAMKYLPGVDSHEQECLLFLVSHMPARDLEMNVSMLVDTVTFALEARRTVPWGKSVPWGVFLNDVLPYSVLAEPRNPWRPLLWQYFATFMPQLRAMNISTAANWLNNIAWKIDSPPIHFVAAPPNELNAYSPFEVIGRGNSSCTGLSIFLVAALRTIGIPARVAGTPHWNLGNGTCPHGDASPACGNHNWVEAWTGDGWSFIDEVGVQKLNSSWFFPSNAQHQVPGTLNHSIFATSWMPSTEVLRDYGGDDDPLAKPVPRFPMVWDWNDTISSAWDVTKRYLSMIPNISKNEH